MLEEQSNQILPNIQIEVTNYCNLICYMCPSRAMTRKKGIMEIEVYKNIINQIKQKTNFDERKSIRLSFCGQGEPLVNKNIYEMIKIAKSEGFLTEITTNAILLNEKNIVNLVESGIDIICLSWYAFDEETYQKIYGRKGFSKFLNNIFKLFHYVNSNNPNIIISCNWLSSSHNQSDSDFALWLFNRLPVARTRGHRVRNYRQLFEAINLNEKDIVMDRLNKHKNENPNDNLIGLGCIWSILYIHWNGEVYPCVADYNGDYLVGNIKNENILDMWNNKKMINFRKQVIEGKDFDKGKYCNYCTAGTPKSIAENINIKYSYRKPDEFNNEILNYKYKKYCELFPKSQEDNWTNTLNTLKNNWIEINKRELYNLNEIINNYIKIYDKQNQSLYIVGEVSECIQCIEYIKHYLNNIEFKYKLIDKKDLKETNFNLEELILICDYQNNKKIYNTLKNSNIKEENIINLYSEDSFNYFYKHYHDDFNIVGQYKYNYSL